MLIVSANLLGVEILEEVYVLENIIPYLQKSRIYELNGKEVKAIKVEKKILKALKINDDPFYFYNSKGEKVKVEIGDYIISPLTLSEIYSEKAENFLEMYKK